MKEIIVTSQAELDALPVDFDGRIIIKFGTPYNRAIIKRRFKYSVVARDNSSVEAWGNSSVVARENSSVVARENSSVEAWENSSVEAWGNTQVVDSSRSHNITANGNSRIVHNPGNINEYLDHYNIHHSNGKANLYKAVHKVGGRFVSDKNWNFEYIIGQTATADFLDADRSIDCGHGIHIAYKEWDIDFGFDWPDLAILEVEADIASIVVPDGCTGKVRTDKVLVLREVPLEECGLLGNFLAKKRCAK